MHCAHYVGTSTGVNRTKFSESNLTIVANLLDQIFGQFIRFVSSVVAFGRKIQEINRSIRCTWRFVTSFAPESISKCYHKAKYMR